MVLLHAKTLHRKRERSFESRCARQVCVDIIGKKFVKTFDSYLELDRR